MMKRRVFWSILGVALTVLLASLVLIVGVLHGYFQDRVVQELAQATAYVAHGVENEGMGYLTEDLPGDDRVTWVAADGTVLFDDWENAAELKDHADREEIREALTVGSGEAVRYSDTLSQETIYAARRLEDGSVVRVSNSQYVRILFGVEEGVEVFTRYQTTAPSGGETTSESQDSSTQGGFPGGDFSSGGMPSFGGGGMPGGMGGGPMG